MLLGNRGTEKRALYVSRGYPSILMDTQDCEGHRKSMNRRKAISLWSWRYRPWVIPGLGFGGGQTLASREAVLRPQRSSRLPPAPCTFLNKRLSNASLNTPTDGVLTTLPGSPFDYSFTKFFLNRSKSVYPYGPRGRVFILLSDQRLQTGEPTLQSP